MALREYLRKRDLSRTPEPAPRKTEEKRAPLAFVVQKHRASHLHYDLRIEAGGALKSWAVPKGPSLDPRVKRLAMMVEDHPLDYAGFEGTIPEGNYGAGTVMVWDRGTYRPAHGDGDPGEEIERQIRDGRVAFVLEGHKLKGEFYLVRMPSRGENAWLLFKKDDDTASGSDITREDRSVLSGRDLREIAGGTASRPVGIPAPDLSPLEAGGVPRASIPHIVRPMLATLVDEPFDRQGWLFEIKWDGYRAIAQTGPQGTRLYSRNGQDFSRQFEPVFRSLSRFSASAVIDGEIVAVDQKGRADFQLLQNYIRTGRGILVYYVFDLLFLAGYDLRSLPLRRRKELLERFLSPLVTDIRFSSHIEDKGLELFRFVVENGVEGMLAKDGSSVYEEGRRTRTWQKVKAEKRQEAVIGGFTAPKGGRTRFGSLLLGLYDEKGGFVYIGHSGGGFSDRELDSLFRRLQPLERQRSPFRNLESARDAAWVEPRLVCEVRFTEWTQEGLMRHPVFLGLRSDKAPSEVRREAPQAAPVRRFLPVEKKENEETVAVSGREVKLTNLSKVFWPDEGYTKLDLIEYYRTAASRILPFLTGRPESLHRFPNGIHGKSFFHKNVGDIVPDWVKTYTVREPGEEPVSYMVCQDEASLLYMVNLGCIEINPWNSRIQRPDYPDYLVLDFDPHLASFADVVEAVLVTHEVLEKIGCPSYCKTSGAKGMHVYVPLAARYTYDQARTFAELVNRYVNSLIPAITSVKRMPHAREGKVYLDFLQNGKGKTMAAPYSVRPKEKATVSCPLAWNEVTRKLDPAQFTIRTMPERMQARGNAWERGVLGKGVDLLPSLTKLDGLYKDR
ncbi:MAG: DNA ligase D [Deltaproteobacteria bacterium]